MARIDARPPARPRHPALILLLNGAFGIGKTTVARALVARVPRGVLYDPEIIGIALQRLLRLTGREVDDFQALKLWRRLTVAGVRITRAFSPNVVVPMAWCTSACDGAVPIRRQMPGVTGAPPNVARFTNAERNSRRA